LKIAEEVGISYRKAKDYIKFLRLNDYIKFPEKDVCTIINKDFKDVTEEMYLPDYLRYVIKEKGVKWSPIFTRILNYISKKIRYYKYCKEIAEYNLDVWNEEELKKKQILKIVEWLYNNEDWKESDYDKVYDKAVKMAHKHALEAIKWNNCEVSFYESPKRIAGRMKCSVDCFHNCVYCGSPKATGLNLEHYYYFTVFIAKTRPLLNGFFPSFSCPLSCPPSPYARTHACTSMCAYTRT
jgi:hypothetical protein